MPNDGGTIKWTSLMLPEHVEMLKKLWDEEEKVVKPQLDQQELEHMNQVAQRAFHNKEQIQLSTHHNGERHSYYGIITKVDPLKKTLEFQPNSSSTTFSCSFNEIIHIE